MVLRWHLKKGYQLYIYDVNGKKTVQPNIALNRNQVLGKLKEFNISGNISNFDVSPDGKRWHLYPVGIVRFGYRRKVCSSDAKSRRAHHGS
jgi:hypothetical protein